MKNKSNSQTALQRVAQARRFVFRPDSNSPAMSNARLAHSRIKAVLIEYPRLGVDAEVLGEFRRIWAETSGRDYHSDLVSLEAFTSDQLEVLALRLNTFANILQAVMEQNPEYGGKPLVQSVQWRIVRHIGVPAFIKEFFNMEGVPIEPDIQSFADEKKASTLAALDDELFLRVAKTSFAQPRDEHASGWRELADVQRVEVGRILSLPRFENDSRFWRLATAAWLSVQLQSENFDNFADFNAEQLQEYYYRMHAFHLAVRDGALSYNDNDETLEFVEDYLSTGENISESAREFYSKLFADNAGNEQVMTFIFTTKKGQE